MRSRNTAAAAIIALAVALPVHLRAQNPTPPSAVQQGAANNAVAHQLMNRFAIAWSADDSAAVVAMFSDSVALVSRTSMVGVAEVGAWARKQMAGALALKIIPLSARAAGDLAYQVGRWEIGIPDNQIATGVHTFTFRRGKDGVWRIETMFILDDPRASP